MNYYNEEYTPVPFIINSISSVSAQQKNVFPPKSPPLKQYAKHHVQVLMHDDMYAGQLDKIGEADRQHLKLT